MKQMLGRWEFWIGVEVGGFVAGILMMLSSYLGKAGNTVGMLLALICAIAFVVGSGMYGLGLRSRSKEQGSSAEGKPEPRGHFGQTN